MFSCPYNAIKKAFIRHIISLVSCSITQKIRLRYQKEVKFFCIYLIKSYFLNRTVKQSQNKKLGLPANIIIQLYRYSVFIKHIFKFFVCCTASYKKIVDIIFRRFARNEKRFGIIIIRCILMLYHQTVS